MANSYDEKQRIEFAFRAATAREPTAAEIELLRKLFQQRSVAFQQDRTAAAELLSVGQSKCNENFDPAELAAWTTVASAILNLDETITRQ